MYVCGPTVYSLSHIGHMVGPVIFDTVKKHLVYSGYEVTWVVNITDVDDKLIQRVPQEGATTADMAAAGEGLAEEVTADYLACLDGTRRRRHRPHAPRDRTYRRDHRHHAGPDRQGLRLRRPAATSTSTSRPTTDYGKLSHRDPEELRGRRARSSRPRRSGTPATSPSGRPPSPASRPGRAPGGPGAPAGTSSARP